MTAVLVISACGNSTDDRPDDSTFGRITAQEVIDATRRAGTAKALIALHTSTTESSGDPGTSADEEQNLAIEAEFDFERERSVARWQFPADEVVGKETPPISVEARIIGETAYVRDGRWLCPMCGIDAEDELPGDEWITVPVPPGGAFGSSGVDIFTGALDWLALVQSSVAPERTEELDGVPVAVYETSVPVTEVQQQLDALAADEPSLDLQGDIVTITFSIDDNQRLRRLAVSYRSEDRDQAITATLSDFGSAVEVERPPSDEIYGR